MDKSKRASKRTILEKEGIDTRLFDLKDSLNKEVRRRKNIFKEKQFYSSLDSTFEHQDLPVTHPFHLDKSVNDLKDHFQLKYPVKAFFTSWIVYQKPTPKNRDHIVEEMFTAHDSVTLLNKGDVGKLLQTLHNVTEEVTLKGSGWSFVELKKLTLNTAKYQPLKASSFIDLPEHIKKKRAIINVQNKDKKCFMWSLLSKKFPVKTNSNRVKSYKDHVDYFKFKDITFPVKINDIPRIEALNDITVNVYTFDDKTGLIPLYISKQCPKGDEDLDNHYDLFMITNEEGSHYAWIKDFYKLNFGLTKYKVKKYVCRRCLQHFYKSQDLKDHGEYCQSTNTAPCKIVMPSPGAKVKFRNQKNMLKNPFVVYADFESMLIPIQEQKGQMQYTQRHEICSFCYVIVDHTGKYWEPVVYTGENAASEFLKRMRKEWFKIYKILSDDQKPLTWTEESRKAFSKADKCWICEKVLKEDKVADHDHLTGEYRGAAHQACNLKLQIRPKEYQLPIFFHNLKGYDAHFICQAVTDQFKRVDCIGQTSEKYLTFRLDNLRFLDSFQHLGSSLSKLAKSLTTFPITSDYIEEEDIGKGVFPYEYITDWMTLEEMELPPKECFYSTLRKSGITDQEYVYAQSMWNKHKCETLRDYLELYLWTDVTLLADIFENYRNTCLDNYKLDPSHYITAPGLSWDAYLKSTHVSIDLLSDQKTFQFVESGIRGGISMLSHSYAKANNKYLEDYDPTKASNYIIYLDANNLYGHAMSEFLPISQFRMVEHDHLDATYEKILKYSKDNEVGAFLKVDLEYPHELHELHNDLPMAVERRPDTEGKMKLIPNLYNKKEYVCHYRLLQFYLKHGLKVTKVHDIMLFEQTPHIKDYIHKNTELRKQAKTEFEKSFFKLLNNANFGKTMENVRRRQDIRLVTNKKKAKKLIAQPHFKHFHIFTEDLSAVSMSKSKVELNKPIFVGMTVLELSKLLMYKFYYEYFKVKYPDARLLYTDTDSYIVDVKTEDIYEDFAQDKDLYDFSDYPKDHPLYSTHNKKVIGKFKDEMGGEPVSEFIGLQAKMYYVSTASKEIKRAKGINKAVVDQEVTRTQYKQALDEGKTFEHTCPRFQSKQHVVKTVGVQKKSLCHHNTKRVGKDERAPGPSQ